MIGREVVLTEGTRRRKRRGLTRWRGLKARLRGSVARIGGGSRYVHVDSRFFGQHVLFFYSQIADGSRFKVAGFLSPEICSAFCSLSVSGADVRLKVRIADRQHLFRKRDHSTEAKFCWVIATLRDGLCREVEMQRTCLVRQHDTMIM